LPARRVLRVVAILLLSFALVSSISPRPQQRAAAPTVPAQPAGAAAPRPETVDGRLPADRIVHAREGDVVDLQVTSREPDVARVDALGVSAPTEPGLPAQLTFVADRAGRFAVDLRDAGERVGTLEITER
jgi:hypothetical protein